MNALLDQLGLNNSFFFELGIIAALFIILSHLYFQPFLRLFEARYKKTVKDRESAERLVIQANAKLDEYKRILAEERLAAKKAYDFALIGARKQEFDLMSEARDEAKKITQDAADGVQQQRDLLKNQLQKDVEFLAQSISEKLLSRKV